MARRNGRQRGQLPTCYYEGYLEKRSFKDKTSRKLWSCLCGNVLFFFNDKRDADYVERLDVSRVISIEDDNSQDRVLDAARFTVTTKQENLRLTAPNAEARELWKGYIYSVSKLSVPSFLTLLPGQLHMLHVAVDQEKERQQKAPIRSATSRSFDSGDADLPPCYHGVSRLEAELLLEKESKKGNLLLRPGSTGNSFSITTRQEDHAGAIYRHYRVSRTHDGGFAIALDNPVPCPTLQDVVDYLVEKTDRVLVPLIFEEQYEKSITYLQSDNENGEISVKQALTNNVVRPNVVPPTLPQRKPAYIQPDNENGETSVKRAPTNNIVRPNVVPPSLPHRKPAFIQPDNENGETSVQRAALRPNIVPPSLPPKPVKHADRIAEEEEDDDFDSELQQPRRTVTTKPPVPAPRKSLLAASTPSLVSSTNAEQRMRSHTDPFGQTIELLKRRFEQNAK